MKTVEFLSLCLLLPFLSGCESAEKPRYSETEQGFAVIRASEFPDDRFLLGASGKYWKDFLQRDAVEGATTIPQPMLVLQGDKDYQVTVANDLTIREQALKTSRESNYRIVRFARHNHLFVSIQGESTGSEYAIPGHVDPEVIDRIANWDNQHQVEPVGMARARRQ